MPTYKGTRKIGQVLSYQAIDEQLRKLENFDNTFIEEFQPAMADALGLAEGHAKKNAPEATGQLKGKIGAKVLGVLRSSMTIRGQLQADDGLKAFAQEAGRWYTNARRGRWHKTGRFYLYYGAKDKAKEIMQIYQQANQRVVNKLVVKS
jgi:hypothetical protein